MTTDYVIDPSVQLKSLSDSGRLLLARLLLAGSFNVTELTRILDVAQSTVSRNLRILVDAGLLAGRREGRLVFYTWRTDLAAAARDLRRWVTEYSPDLAPDLARRLQDVWDDREAYDVEGVPIEVVSRDGLLRMKRIAGRRQDLSDIEHLELGGDEA